MGNLDRAIRYAIDTKTGEVLDAEKIFENRLTGYEIRKGYNRDEIFPICLECFNKLVISTSTHDRIYFRHSPSDEYCIFKDENLSPYERGLIIDIYRSKESERHKYLKNKIGALLNNIKGVENIQIDNRFIFDSQDKRKPDIYFKYYDKKIVFEIQLSKLSQRYILKRYDFYRKKGMYLLWILDNFDVLGDTQTEKDIKYLSEHQNYFSLDENSEKLAFLCKYKHTYLDNMVYKDKWNEVTIPIEKFNFDEQNFEIYFYNFGKEKSTILQLQRDFLLKKEKELAEQKAKEKIETEKREKERKEAKSNERINTVIRELQRLKEKHVYVYKSVEDLLSEFEDYDLQKLNKRFDLDNTDKNKIKSWFLNAVPEDYGFLNFILDNHYIEFDINKVRDPEGNRLIDFIFQNNAIKNWHIHYFKKALKRGHKFSTEEENYIRLHYKDEKVKADRLITISHLANKFENPIFIQYLFDFEMLVCILESSRQNRIIGYNYKPNEWINFANNVIQYYPEYWEYIEIVFKHHGLFDKLIELDHKESFRKKLLDFYSTETKTNYSFEWLYKALYPELSEVYLF